MIVIIPSNRDIKLSYLQPLIEYGAKFIIVYDSNDSISIKHPSFQVFNWKNRKKILGKYDRYFPRKNGACRNFGFYLAYKSAEKNEIIIALDDDCEIDNVNFPEQVEQVLNMQDRKKLKYPFTHFNILNLYKNVDSNLYPRGFPYQSRNITTDRLETENIYCGSSFNLGLWRGIFDINAIDKINGPDWNHSEIKLKYDNVLIPKDILISVCSMNMQFRKELIPAVFQFPMHVEIFKNWHIDRYGDIWGGFLLKRLMDIKDDPITVGSPVINHLNTGNYLKNIWQEHLAHLINDELIKIISDSCTNIKKGDYLDMYIQVYDNLRQHTNTSPILKQYLQELLPAMHAWIKSLL